MLFNLEIKEGGPDPLLLSSKKILLGYPILFSITNRSQTIKTFLNLWQTIKTVARSVLFKLYFFLFYTIANIFCSKVRSFITIQNVGNLQFGHLNGISWHLAIKNKHTYRTAFRTVSKKWCLRAGEGGWSRVIPLLDRP